MQTIAIRQNNPNQIIDFDYNNNAYAIHLYTIYVSTNTENIQEYMTLADVYINGSIVSAGVKCIPSQPIIPQTYQTIDGNFYWECVNNDYPIYTQFGQTQKLVFYTTAEIEMM